MADFSELVASQRALYLSGRTRELSWRRSNLEGMIKMLEENEEAFVEACKKDMNKHRVDTVMFEVGMTRNEAVLHLNHLDEWTKPQRVSTQIQNRADKCYTVAEPFGTTLVIGAWNYPVQLVLLPVVGAIAAGNTVVMKPSEIAPATAEVIGRLVPKYLDPQGIAVVNGGVPETTALLKERWDLIFYTGNNVVAKIIYEAAAKHLTPVILELGGKSPVYVDGKTSDLKVVAQRLAWGKYSNSGQICVAPDYIMCTKETQDALVPLIKEAIEKFYTADPKTSDSYCRIVNGRHVQRVKNLMSSGTVAIGGEVDEANNYIAPTVLINVKPTDPVMQEEIFGPVMPFYTVKDEDEAIDFINAREKPLALYVFTNNNALADKFVARTSSGGMLVNDCVVHLGVETLPFGGVGHSGLGQYHGKYTFEAFSHSRALMKKNQGMEAVNNMRYPPYTDRKLGIMRWMLTAKRKKSGIMSLMPFAILALALGLVMKMIGLDRHLPAVYKALK